MEDSRDIQSLREELEQIQKEIEHARKQKSTEEMLRREIDKARQELADLTSDKGTNIRRNNEGGWRCNRNIFQMIPLSDNFL